MRDHLIAFIKACNARRCYMRLDAGPETTVSLVFGGNKYAEPDDVIVYEGDDFTTTTPEAAADKFLAAYELTDPKSEGVPP